MSLTIKDKQLLENYNKIWKKNPEKLMKIDFNIETTYGDDDDKYMKTKTKTYKDSIITYEKHCPQTFLEECKYAKEKIKTNNYIDTELESESDIDTDIDNEE